MADSNDSQSTTPVVKSSKPVSEALLNEKVLPIQCLSNLPNYLNSSMGLIPNQLLPPLTLSPSVLFNFRS